jgi:hypothetical protein
MQVYNYDKDTGAYVSTVNCPVDPMEPDRFLQPAFSTEVALIPDVGGNIRIFKDGAWLYQAVGTTDEPTLNPQPPSNDLIDEERNRRIQAGHTFQVDSMYIPLQGAPNDQINLIALKESAKEYAAAGITAPIIPFRDAMNTIHQLTPDQMVRLVNAGLGWVSGIYQKSWAMKDNFPRPMDYTNDMYWS